MATRAIRQDLGSLTSYRYGVDSYNQDQLGLGPLMVQIAGSGEAGFAGPAPIGLARPMEQTTAIASQFPWAMRWQNNTAGEIDWIFLADLSAVAATRRINAYSYNRRTSTFTWKGFVTVTYPHATNVTIRAQRMTYDLHTAGTVSVSGTAVTGSSTTWQTDKACVGNRIGFGSTDPTQISTWYEISAIGSDTGITLSTSAGTIAGGTAYVIEDLRCIQLHTNATTTNGGIFVIKGLNWNQFSSIGGTVPAAVSTDNIRAAYWLKDAGTVTHTVGIGGGLAARTSATSQFFYTLDTLANPIVFKTNVRAALTVASGIDTTAFVYKTGAGGALTGAPTQLNNGRLATLQHGAHANVEALYFTTASRIYGAPTSGITTGSTTWLSSGSVMTEVPPGGVNTFAATGGMSAIEHSDALDKLIIMTNATGRNYITQHRTDNGQLDRLFGVNTLQIDQSTADSDTTPIASQTGGAYSMWSEGGMAYITTAGTTAIINRLYAVPLGADWEYASSTGCRIIMPRMQPTNIDKIIGFFANEAQVIGGATGKNLGLQPEPFRMYYRTSGISDDSGSWTLLDGTGEVNIDGASSVQLMFEFRTIGTLNIPARILNCGMLYTDLDTDEHFLVSDKSDPTAKEFVFWFATAYGGTVPELRIRIYDAVTDSLLVDDTSVGGTGTWTKSTDGTTFGTFDTTDRGNDTTYYMYVPASIADDVTVRPILTLA